MAVRSDSSHPVAAAAPSVDAAGRALLTDRNARIPPPFKVAEMDQATLLTAAELFRAPECRVTPLAPDKLIVKYDPARTYLTVTPAQWRALQVFGEGRTVPQVVFQIIVDRACPPLREFYELVVKAQRCGILQTAGQAGPAAVPPARWNTLISPRIVRGAALASILIGLITVCVRPLQPPADVWQLLAGWALACACASLDYWLSAGVTRHANAEVYRPEFRWKTLGPHFHADLHDAIMAGSKTVIDVGVARMGPTFFAMAATAFFFPALALPLFCGVLVLLSPFWWSPGLVVVHARYGVPQLDALHHFQFQPNRAIWYAFRTRLKHADLRFLGVHSLYGTTWLGLVLLTSSLFLRANAEELWDAYVRANGLHFTAIALLALLGLAVVATLGVFATIGALVLRDWLRERRRARRKPRSGQATPEEVAQVLAESVLFKQLPEADRAAIAQALRAEEFPADAVVVREGDRGDNIYLVFSGEVEVVRRLPSGRQEPVATLGTGELFGEIALLHSGVRTRTVQTLKKSVLLSLTKEAFDALVLSKVSRDDIEDTIQKIGFLHRIPFSANWTPHAMASFSRRARFCDFAEGAYLIHEGEDNDRFYVVYEGQLSVRQRLQELGRLGIGDFFGEISLLENSTTKATIVALTPGRAVVMNKRDFLQFLANDFLIGLEFEAISSKRLGHDIFPLKAGSFDVIRA